MAQHRALRAAGRARRVENRGEIVRPARGVGEGRRRAGEMFGQRAVALHAERDHMRDAGLFGDGRELFARRGIAHEDARLGVAEEIGDLRWRIGGVERQENGAGAHAAEIEQNRLGRFVDLHGDAVAGNHAQRREGGRHARRTLGEIAVGRLHAVVVFDEDFFGRGKTARNDIVQICGHGGAPPRVEFRPNWTRTRELASAPWPA